MQETAIQEQTPARPGKKRGKGRPSRLAHILVLLLLTACLLVPGVSAEGMGGGSGEAGNAITESTVFTGAMKMLKDGTTALLIIAPIASGVLVAVFALMKSTQSEEHDKQKWGKNIKNVLITLAIIMGSSALVNVVSSYFTGGA